MSKKGKITVVDFDFGIDGIVPSQNFAYVAIKKLSLTQDIDALKISGLERSVTMFQELKSKGVL